MKKVLYLLAIISSSFIVSCEDVLNRVPLDQISDDNVWEDPNLIDAYVLDVYGRMIFLYNDLSQYSLANPQLGVQYAFNIFNDQSTNARQWLGQVLNYTKGNYNESRNAVSFDQWHYGTIRKINDFFEKIEDAPIEQAQKNEFIGRMFLARAFIYFTMAKWYGGVPVITEAQPVDTPVDSLRVPRSTEEQVYDYVLAQCDSIIDNALLPTTPSRKGDPSVYVAYALKSRAALYAASIARWGEVKIDGLTGIPASEEQRYWQACYEASSVLTDENSPFSLYEKNADLAENYRMLFIDEDNTEAIFTKYYDGVAVYNNWTVDNGLSGWTASWRTVNIAPLFEFVESFENSTGGIPEWDRDAISDSAWTYDELYGDLEPRFHAMIVTQGTKDWCGYNEVEFFEKIKTADGTETKQKGANLHTAGWQFSGFGIKKKVDPNGSIDNNSGNTPMIVFRLAEMYLNLAEAALYLENVNNEEARVAVNKIRARVGLPEHATIDEARIRQERKIELAFETHRHWDLKRWRKSVEVLEGKKWTGVIYTKDVVTGKFHVLFNPNYRTTGFSDKMYYFPIGQNRIANNPALAPENPGY